MTSNLPTAGWYPEPSHGVGLRYWDGHAWTEHVYVSGQQYTSELSISADKITTGHISADRIQGGEPSEEVPTKKKIYWSNLFRFRTWWFAFASSMVILFLFSVIGVPGTLWTPAFLISFAAIGWFWLHQQMACRSCGTVLRVTRLSGGQEVCHRCGTETDKSLQK